MRSTGDSNESFCKAGRAKLLIVEEISDSVKEWASEAFIKLLCVTDSGQLVSTNSRLTAAKPPQASAMWLPKPGLTAEDMQSCNL